jgi:hypothetical protein
VQIVEANDYSVRVAELRLTRRASPMRFVLYPMLHVGSPAFYRDVTDRLRAVDLIVAEGISGPTRAGDQLTASYRMMAADESLGLAVQHLDVDDLGVRVIRPDPSGAHFDTRWETVPRWQRGATRALGSSFTAAQRLFGSRFLQQGLSRMSFDDLPSQTEILERDPLPDVSRVVTDERDALLVSALDELHDQRSQEAITVAVVYGAMHMRAVVNEFSAPHGYVVRGGDWLTVMLL